MNKASKTLLRTISAIIYSGILIITQTSCSTFFKNNTVDDSLNKKVQDYGDTGGLTLPISDKPVTIKYLVSSEYPNRGDTWAFKELEKRTGVHLEIQANPPSSYHDKLKIILASGNIPDIIYLVQNRDLNTLGPQGLFVPINKYVNELPNFKRIFVDENSWVLDTLVADDNNLYFWPYYESERVVNHGFLYRKDIFDKHGIKMWENKEEFYQALKKLKEIYPDSVPYSSKTKEGIFNNWATWWGIKIPIFLDKNSNKWTYSFTQPEFKNMLDFMKKLYNEGLIDPKFLTDTQAEWTAKMTQRDKTFVTYDWIGRLDMFYEQVKSDIPEYDLRYAQFPGAAGKTRPDNKISDSGLAVANNPNRIQALKLLDYATSPSGAELLTMGAEGITYEKNSSGKITYPDFSKQNIGIKDLEEKFGLFMMGVYTRMDQRSVYFNYSPKEQEAQDWVINNTKQEVKQILRFNKEEQNTVSDIESILLAKGNDFASRYIMNKSYGEAEWNDWVKAAENLGAKKLENAYNQAQKRYDATKK